MRNYLHLVGLSAFLFFPILGFSDDSSGGQSVDYEAPVPYYHYVKPRWGVEITSSLSAFGGRALTTAQGTSPAYALTALLEYQPEFVQRFGVLGFGPSFAVYPIIGSGSSSLVSPISLLSVGGQVRYQARYFRKQPIVPIVAYCFEYLKYQFSNGLSGNLLSSGPVLGLWLLLNSLDEGSATQMYYDTGISRSYLALEWKNLTSNDPQLGFTGGSYYFGLRMEF